MSLPELVQPPACPDPELWVRFAAGICAPEQSSLLLDHAAGCRDCANRFRDLVNAISYDESDLDSASTAAIEELSTRLNHRSRLLSRKIASPKGSWRFKRYWMVAVAAGVATLIVLKGWSIITSRDNSPPFRLLATAYTSRRTMDLQIPGAHYARVQVPRTSITLSDLPPALLESQLQIERHLETKPEDSTWLHAQGRAQLLIWQFDAAIRSFEAAADLGAHSPDFLIDYASAYYQRAERNSTALDYALALEKLGQALKQRPEDPTALFNRGIVHAKLHQYDSAAEDFEHSLRAQTDPQWREETQKRLDEVRRLRAALWGSEHTATGEFQAEHDLEVAMVSDLLSFFRRQPSGVEETATEMLAQHRDPWLRDVIQLRPSPQINRAVELLSQMAQLRVKVNPDYERLAAQIRWLNSVSLPLSLRVWRDYEILYRDTRSSAVANCASRIGPLIASGKPYPWMEAQILLESSLCSAATQDFIKAGVLVDSAEQLVIEKKLASTSIRIPIFRGQRLAETGYFREALQAASEVLTRFDAAEYPLRRAYDAHGIIMLAASQLNLPHTGYGASRMMASIGEHAGILLFEMVGRCRQAGFALSLGFEGEAGAELQSAEMALARLGRNPTANIYWRTSRIAWLESRQDLQALYRMLQDAHRDAQLPKENLYFNRKLIAAICRLESRAGRRSVVEKMADRFWQDATDEYFGRRTGIPRAFRPELESVSRSLTTVRIDHGDDSGALESWERFLKFDQLLLGEREMATTPDQRISSGAILTVADLGEKVAVWFHSGQQTRFHWAASSYTEFSRSIRKLRRLCSLGASTSDISSEARALFRILFPEGLGAASRIFIRARGVFNILPLSAFSLLDEGNGAVFSFLPYGEQPGPVSTSPTKSMSITLVAATNFDGKPGLPALQESEIDEEIAAARQAFASTVVIRGAKATSKAMETAAMDSQILHFTGHAALRHGTIGLLVSPDPADQAPDGRAGFWSMSHPRSVNADLVVLSACSTGAFEDPATVEPGQLALSMLLAGARQVVASLWDVDSSAATAWNRAFYGNVAAGQPPAIAMKLAGEQLRGVPQWQSSKYWAAFALYQQ